MPRYFFDVCDAEGAYVDEVGIELDDMETAIREARRALSDMMRDTLREGARDALSINIRDGADGPVMLSVNLTTVSSTRKS